MSKVCDVDTAVAQISDGASVASTGVLGWSTPDAVLRALGRRFDRSGTPENLTFYFACATGDGMDIRGMDHVARPGLMRRIVAGSYINPRHPVTGQRPALTALIQNDLVEAYNWPIGATMHWLREVARRSPGYLTEVGLGTFIDPRLGGGKFTTLAKEDLVEVVKLRGREYLFYPSWPLDVGIVRASSADDQGNLSFEDQPLTTNALALALAVKASGGTVIAQVARMVARGSRGVHEVRLPGVLVDHVVLAADEWTGTDVRSDPGYLGNVADPVARLPRLPSGPGKTIARRVGREIRPGETSILGFGRSSEAVLAMAEDGAFADGRLDDYIFTTEHGSFGGAVMSGWQFSANYSPDALLDGPSQFDFIDGGGCPFAALAFAQFDAAGNVNVSRFGEVNPGSGGFIDIAHHARRLVFAGTFRSGGPDRAWRAGQPAAGQAGTASKFVPEVEHITYRAADGLRRGQQTRIVTERAVLDLTETGLVLSEIAPGVDVVTDVLDQIGFPIRVARELKTMDSALFRP